MTESHSNESFDSILASLMEACEQSAGLPLDIEAWVQRYPQHAEQIRSYLASRQQLEAVLGPRGAFDPSANTLAIDGPAANVGTHVRYFGDYELIQEIARGGMGVVYKARQSSLQRIVALKMILSGSLATVSDVIRFRAEAEAVANLDHPHIVPIYEIGEQDRQQYFTMKLIEGGSLSKTREQHLQQSAVDRQRWIASFMIKVASAVQHAHERGILHRDLKPGNILVNHHGEPHVTDFGLAKKVTADSELTHTGAILGTPAYMAPEQARGERSLTTAVDIYSLGAILYELLVGKVPFTGNTPFETMRAVVEKSPPIPSSILASIDRDLETITLKCMEKQPTARYRTAADLAADLERWLAGEPILARRVGAIERARKWVRRNPVVSGLLSVSLLLGLGVIAALTALLSEARLRAEETQRSLIAANEATERERKLVSDAQTARDQARSAEETERQARIDEEQERKYSQAIADFVIEDFLAITSIEGQERFGGEGLDRSTTVYQLLERAGQKLATRTDIGPRVEAQLNWIIGINFRGAGDASKGIPFLERSVELRRSVLGHEAEETLNAMNSLAICYSDSGRVEDSVRLLEDVLTLRKKVLGPDHIFTLRTMNALAVGYRSLGRLEESYILQKDTLSRRISTLGPEDPDTLTSMNNLARIYKSQGRLMEAIELYESTHRLRQDVLGAEHRHTLETMNHLASCYEASNQLNKALPLYKQTLECRKRILGIDHPDVLISMNNLAGCCKALGRLEESVSLYERTVEYAQAKLGSNHPHTLMYLGNLAAAYWSAGHLDRSVPTFEKLLVQNEGRFGRKHPETIRSIVNLGVNYVDVGREEQGLLLLEEAFAASQQLPELPWVRLQLKDVYAKAKRFEEFRKLADEDLALARKKFPSGSVELGLVLVATGQGYLSVELFDSAIAPLKEGMQVLQAQTPNDWKLFNARALLGAAMLGIARLEADEHKKQQLLTEAEPMLVSAYEGLKACQSTIPPHAANCLSEARGRLIELLTAQNRIDEANAYRHGQHKTN